MWPTKKMVIYLEALVRFLKKAYYLGQLTTELFLIYLIEKIMKTQETVWCKMGKLVEGGAEWPWYRLLQVGPSNWSEIQKFLKIRNGIIGNLGQLRLQETIEETKSRLSTAVIVDSLAGLEELILLKSTWFSYYFLWSNDWSDRWDSSSVHWKRRTKTNQDCCA